MEATDIENLIFVNMDSNIYMTLIHFNVYKTRELSKTKYYIW